MQYVRNSCVLQNMHIIETSDNYSRYHPSSHYGNNILVLLTVHKFAVVQYTIHIGSTNPYLHAAHVCHQFTMPAIRFKREQKPCIRMHCIQTPRLPLDSSRSRRYAYAMDALLTSLASQQALHNASTRQAIVSAVVHNEARALLHPLWALAKLEGHPCHTAGRLTHRHLPFLAVDLRFLHSSQAHGRPMPFHYHTNGAHWVPRIHSSWVQG